MNTRAHFVAIAFALAPAGVGAEPLDLRSPDGRNRVTFDVGQDGRPTYAVSRDGRPIIAASPIMLELDRGRIGEGMRLTGSDRRDADERYPIVVGKAAEGRAQYRELSVELVETGAERRRMTIEFRAFDDGIAFRTSLPPQPETAAAIVRTEETEFRFAETPSRCWGLNIGSFGRSHEGEYDPIDPVRIREHNLFDLPLLCETGRAAFAITEADLLDFAGMYLIGRGDGGAGVKVRLSPSLDDPRVAVRSRIGSPVRTPWRVVMLADRAGELVQSTLVTDLATPSRVAETSWIRPGLVSWDWWNGGRVPGIDAGGTTTEKTKAFIDFAAENGLPYTLVDDGWYAGAGGGGVVRPGADITRVADGFDLDEVMRHARARGVGVWLWLNWQSLDAQMEEALALYARLGVVGIKVDFMDRDDQWMVQWYERLMEATARHRLMINMHGAFVPRGLTRTYPHYVTQEGVLGAEYNKWSRRITARHNVMLAYTRNLLGPADYTPGGFRNVAPADFTIRNDLPFVQTTRAHGIAMYLVYDSPVATVADSPVTYGEMGDGLDVISALPTSWDETRFVGGEVGEWIAVARRKGDRWFVGVMNGDDARQVTLDLSGIGGAGMSAQLIRDGRRAQDVVRERVDAGGRLTLDLAATGGAVLIVGEVP